MEYKEVDYGGGSPSLRLIYQRKRNQRQRTSHGEEPKAAHPNSLTPGHNVRNGRKADIRRPWFVNYVIAFF